MHTDPGRAGRPRSAGTGALLRFVRPFRTFVGLGIALGALGSLAALAQPLVAREVLQAVGGDGGIWLQVLLLLALVLVGAALTGIQMFVLERTGERIILGLRVSMIRRLLRLRVREHDRRSTGELLSRVGADTTLLRSAINTNVFDAVSSVIMIIGALAVMAYLDWVQLLIVVGVLLVVGLVVLPALRRIRLATRSAQMGISDMTAALERALTAHRTVKASVAEEREAELISDYARAAYEAGVRSVKLDAVVGVSSALAVQVSFLTVLGVGGVRVATGAISAADLVAFLLYVMYLASPVIVISTALTQIQRASAAASRIVDIDSMEVEGDQPAEPVSSVPAPAAPAPPPWTGRAIRPALAFREVSFNYRDDVPVLRGLDFDVPAGARTALVGRSGVGKSTVFALLERFYEPASGTILLDGEDIRLIPLHRLRGQIGYVEQDAPILAGTLRDNLLYTVPDAREEDVGHAVEASQLTDLVSRLPNGLDTHVGDHGTQLSGGERQRVALGRLLLRRPRIVLLDEATSQLDTVNERALQDAVDNLAKACTVITIAHRLSTVAKSDHIVVLEDGAVHAMGTHEDLMSGDTLYRRLASGQFLGGEPASR